MNSLALSILIPLAVGGLGAYLSADNVKTWYATLKKPEWTPPGWVFGPVWTVLYVLMGIASWLVWKKTGLGTYPLTLYAVQLLLNGLWSPVFFGTQSIKGGLVVIVLLLGTLVETTRAFWAVDHRAGALLVPYLAWASFAAALNASLAARNTSLY